MTRFRKGQRNGMAAKNWKPIGYERVSKDGILQRKISDTGVTRQDYVPVHVLAWTSAHGPVPRGHIVLFVNKDRTDMRLENLVCVSRADNMRRNTVHRYPKEIALAVQAVGVLNRKINKLEGKLA